MNPDGLIHLTPTPHERAQSQVGIHRVVIHGHGFDKSIDGQIMALVQQVVESLEVILRHRDRGGGRCL